MQAVSVCAIRPSGASCELLDGGCLHGLAKFEREGWELIWFAMTFAGTARESRVTTKGARSMYQTVNCHFPCVMQRELKSGARMHASGAPAYDGTNWQCRHDPHHGIHRISGCSVTPEGTTWEVPESEQFVLGAQAEQMARWTGGTS